MFGSRNKVVKEEKVKKKQEKKLKKIGTIRPHRGHKLFKVNQDTLEISEASFEKSDASYEDIAAGKKTNKKVLVEKGFAYYSALNVKNVKKKISKQLLQAGVPEEEWLDKLNQNK